MLSQTNSDNPNPQVGGAERAEIVAMMMMVMLMVIVNQHARIHLKQHVSPVSLRYPSFKVGGKWVCLSGKEYWASQGGRGLRLL